MACRNPELSPTIMFREVVAIRTGHLGHNPEGTPIRYRFELECCNVICNDILPYRARISVLNIYKWVSIPGSIQGKQQPIIFRRLRMPTSDPGVVSRASYLSRQISSDKQPLTRLFIPYIPVASTTAYQAPASLLQTSVESVH